MITCETQPGQIEAAVENVMLGFGSREALLDLRARGRDKCLEPSLRIWSRTHDVCRERGPALQIFSVFRDMRCRMVRIAEVREKEPRRSVRCDGVERSAPYFQINIRRRRKRNHVRIAFDVK